MFRPLEVYIGLRYVRAKRRNHFISFISMTSMIGIALGIWALITVLSVMNGFEQELRTRILGMASHATIEGLFEPMANWKEVADFARQQPEVVSVAPYVEGQGMVSLRQFSQGVVVRGVVPSEEPKVSIVTEKMKVGKLTDLKPGKFNVIIGVELARSLFGTDQIEQFKTREQRAITLIIPEATVTPAGMLPRFKRFTVVGVFEMGMHEYDSALMLVHAEDAARLYRIKGSVTGVRLKLKNMYEAPRVARELVRKLDGSYQVRDWSRKHVNLFAAINMEKRVMFIILFLIVAVAAFNIVSTLVMVVTDKEADIAILRTLGASPGSIMWIFIIQGAVIGLIGTLLGLATGIPTALNVNEIISTIEGWLDIRFLSPDVYYITDLTSDMQWSDVWTVCGFSLLISLLATIYPAWRASRTQPAEALRYE